MNKHLKALFAITAVLISSSLFSAPPPPRNGGPGPGPLKGGAVPFQGGIRFGSDRHDDHRPGPGKPGHPGKPGPAPAPHHGPGVHPMPHHPGDPVGHHTFPHRHPLSRFAFRWYDYTVGGVVYAPETYKIYECRNCHLVQYSPIVPVVEPCGALPGYGHAYQILGNYGQLAFTCATCGVTVNSATVPAAGACGAGIHVWQQLLQY